MHFSIMKISRDVIRFMYFQMCLYTCHYTSKDFCDWKIHQPQIMINEKFSPLIKNRRVSEHTQHACKDIRSVMKKLFHPQKIMSVYYYF